MENWLILGLSAYLFYAISSSVDKHLMNEDNGALQTNAVKMLLDGFVILVIGFSFLDLNLSILALKYSVLLGTIYALSGVLYFKILQEMDSNQAVPALQSSRLALVFLLSLLLLGEIASWPNFAGVGLSSLGVLMVLSKNGEYLPRFDAGIKFLVANLGLAIAYRLLVKVFVEGVNPETLSTLMYFISGLLLITFQVVRGKNSSFRKVLGRKTFTTIGVAAFFGGTATLMLFKALEIAQASRVYPLAGSQSLFIAVISFLFLKEGLSAQKVFGILTIAAGVYLIQL